MALRLPRLTPRVLAPLAALWIAGLAFGLVTWIGYERRPGEAADAPARWPAASALPAPRTAPVLLHFVHPRCPCSRASLAELEVLLERAEHQPRVVVVFMRPPGTGEGWEKTYLWGRAQRLAGATVIVDRDGRESALFGARTSGQTMLYDAQGALRFSGGITPTRGEIGDNAGRQRLLALLAGREPDRAVSAVFGCPLQAVEARP